MMLLVILNSSGVRNDEWVVRIVQDYDFETDISAKQ